jgi:hypothetical protein
VQAAVSRATIVHYERLAALYARYERNEISQEILLHERAAIFRNASNALRRGEDQLNNVSFANQMTYSRHYPLMESAYNALGRDVGRTVAFFRQVDRTKPTIADMRKQLGTSNDASVEFIRVHESAVAEVIRKSLGGTGAFRSTGMGSSRQGLAQPRNGRIENDGTGN